MAETRPDTTCAAYEAMQTSWRMMRDLMGGTDTMRKAGRLWLPQWPQESSSRYAARLDGSFLFGGLRRSVETMVGKVFSAPIALGEDVPSEIASYAENIDLEGNRLDVVARDWFQDGLETGVSHVMVDHPAVGARTRAEAIAGGIRPYWVPVRAENLLSWKYIALNGRHILTEARIRETVTEPDGEWGEKDVTQIRVWKRLLTGQGTNRPGVYWALYRQDGDGSNGPWSVKAGGRAAIDEIPLVTFYADRTGYMTGRPPLLDLAWKNVEHWQSASAQFHILQLGRRPALYFTGFQKEEVQAVEIGPFAGIVANKADAKVGFAEIQGASIAAGRQHLQDCKEEMAVLGAEMLVRKPVTKTATEASNERVENDSKLSGIVSNFQDAVENALRFTAMWGGGTDGGSVEVSKDFGMTPMDQAELALVLNARQQREISRALFFEILTRRGIIPDDWDLETETATLESESTL